MTKEGRREERVRQIEGINHVTIEGKRGEDEEEKGVWERGRKEENGNEGRRVKRRGESERNEI